jgi:hypothetical protein
MRGLTEVVRGELSTRQRGDERPTPTRELHRQLARERARNAGLEYGITALEDRIRALSAEVRQLRAETA